LAAATPDWFTRNLPNPCPNVPRIRRAFGSLNYEEKSLYANSVFQLRKYQDKYISGSNNLISIFDIFQQMHASSKNAMIHGTSAFPPQHKVLLWLYESALRFVCQNSAVLKEMYSWEQCCALSLPYWDWDSGFIEEPTMPGGGNWGNIANTDVFQNPELFGDTTPQSGTNFIDEGLFAYYTDFDPPGQDIKRAFSFTSLNTAPHIFRNFLVNNPTYSRFLPYLHGPWHGQIHAYVGQTMQLSSTTALDPLFYLHHCNIDRHYHIWIDCHDHEFIEPEDLTDAQYVAVNPIAGEAKADPLSKNVFTVMIDEKMNFFLYASTPTFLPQSDWPTPRDSWTLGTEDEPGWGGIYYRYAGPDRMVNLVDSGCPGETWNWVNYTVPV